MTTKQLTGTHIIRLLTILFMVLGLMTACSTTPEEPMPMAQQAPEPEPAVEPEPAPPVVLQRNYPERYTVKKGDTLWDISARFLKDPWLWPQVWHINPEVRNPHLIYPGDIIVLYYQGQQPYLSLEGPAGMVPSPKTGRPVPKATKISPRIRAESLEQAIVTIPREAIAPFLSRPRIATDDEIKAAPYIVSSYEGHLISGTGNRIYAKGVTNELGAYHVVRKGKTYRDPETRKILGYELLDLADARVIRSGDRNMPTTLIVSKARQEVLNGDLLFPHESRKMDFRFIPRPPKTDVKGQIISVINGVSQIGQYNIVVLNRGKKHGLEPGHVLAIYQKGLSVRDPKSSILYSTITLPDERAGIMMVFRSYEEVSFGLIMEAERPLHLYDVVTNP